MVSKRWLETAFTCFISTSFTYLCSTLAWKFTRTLFFHQMFWPHYGALTNAYPERFACAEHAINTGHTIDWSNTQIKAIMPVLEEVHLGVAYEKPPHPPTLIRDGTPCVHEASTAQKIIIWLPCHVLTVRSHMASFQFVICVQSLGGDIGSECLQSDDSYSLDAFGDIRRADSGPTWPCGHTLTHD